MNNNSLLIGGENMPIDPDFQKKSEMSGDHSGQSLG